MYPMTLPKLHPSRRPIHKPATVETGAEIQVPLFIGEGEKVKVNTTDGSYLGREN